jgi:hypothetical protein
MTGVLQPFDAVKVRSVALSQDAAVHQQLMKPGLWPLCCTAVLQPCLLIAVRLHSCCSVEVISIM